jgi:hypothetical protein
MVDEEQQYLTDLAHRRALKLVAENRTLLEAFAFTLLQNEVLEREDIDQLMLAYRGQTARPNGHSVVRELQPGRAEVAAAEAEPPKDAD